MPAGRLALSGIVFLSGVGYKVFFPLDALRFVFTSAEVALGSHWSGVSAWRLSASSLCMQMCDIVLLSGFSAGETLC